MESQEPRRSPDVLCCSQPGRYASVVCYTYTPAVTYVCRAIAPTGAIYRAIANSPTAPTGSPRPAKPPADLGRNLTLPSPSSAHRPVGGRYPHVHRTPVSRTLLPGGHRPSSVCVSGFRAPGIVGLNHTVFAVTEGENRYFAPSVLYKNDKTFLHLLITHFALMCRGIHPSI